MDRNRNKIIDITLSKSRDKSIYTRMSRRLERQGYMVKLLCTDDYEGYASYKLAETSLIE